MRNRLLRAAAILLLCSLPAVAHAEFIDWLGNFIGSALFIVCALIGVPILLYLAFRRPKTHSPPPKQWPPKA